jgi:hypothetical protein
MRFAVDFFLPQRRIPFTEEPPPAQAQQPHEDGSGEHYRDDVGGGDVAVAAEPDGTDCGGQLIVLGSVTVRSAPPALRGLSCIDPHQYSRHKIFTAAPMIRVLTKPRRVLHLRWLHRILPE